MKVKYFVLSIAILLQACAAYGPYMPDPEVLDNNPARLKIGELSEDSNATSSSLYLYLHEVVCQQPGETKPTVQYLGWIQEVVDEKTGTKKFPEEIIIPGNKSLIIVSGFTKNYLISEKYCSIAIRFTPEHGATYQLSRGYETGFFKQGECGANIHKLVTTPEGERLVELDDYEWGSLYAFQTRKFVCDENGKAREKKPRNTSKPIAYSSR